MSLPQMPMPHEVTILRRSYVERTEFGGEKEQLDAIAGNVCCFVQGASAGEIEKFAKREMSVSTKAYFPTEPPLREGDEILVTKNNIGTSYIGQKFKFQAVDDATAGFGILWKGMFMRETNPVEPVV